MYTVYRGALYVYLVLHLVFGNNSINFDVIIWPKRSHYSWKNTLQYYTTAIFVCSVQAHTPTRIKILFSLILFPFSSVILSFSFSFILSVTLVLSFHFLIFFYPFVFLLFFILSFSFSSFILSFSFSFLSFPFPSLLLSFLFLLFFYPFFSFSNFILLFPLLCFYPFLFLLFFYSLF